MELSIYGGDRTYPLFGHARVLNRLKQDGGWKKDSGWKKTLSEAHLGRSNYLKLLFSTPGVSFQPCEATSRSVSTK